MKDVMLDLETMGNGSNAPICAIGAVLFDSKVYDTPESLDRNDSNRCFYRTVELSGQQEIYGRKVDAGTIYWWLEQSEKARQRISSDRVYIIAALMDFSGWVKHHQAERLWGYGATFDNVILQNAYDALNHPSPFRYRQHRCLRTLVEETQVSCPKWNEEIGVAHDALDDARRQVLWRQRIWRERGI